MPLSWFFHRAACARHDCRLSHVQRARWIILAIYAILISNDTTSANQATPACTHQERPCSPATVARVRALTETAVGEWRARHPALSISPDLSHSLQQAWIAALERRLEPCPSPSTAYQPPPREDCGCLGVPTADTVTTWVKVFGDLDENGQLDPGELGLDDVQVSNGACGDSLPPCTALTEDGGTHTFVTPRHDSRFVFMTVPSGYRATTPFWHRIGAHPDTAYFGLAVEPASADTSFRWVQISDMQVGAEPDEADEHCQDLSEIEQLSSRPAFIVITGDLVMDGDNTPQFENYLTTSDSSCTTIPIHHGYGDHDACTCQTPPCEPVCGPQVYNFEHYVGPSVYSFDYGGIHFVMFNDIHSVNYDPVIPEPGLKQYLWLAEDVITARAQHRDVPIIICKHTMPLAEDLALYAELGGVAAAFSGHYHGSRLRDLVVETSGGESFHLFDVNTPPSRYAGIDKSSRGFRIVDQDGQIIQTEFRQGGIVNHLRICHPAPRDSLVRGTQSTRLWVNAYSSAAVGQTVEYQMVGPGGASAFTRMTPEGSWAWSAFWDSSQEQLGHYEMSVAVTPDVGAPYEETIRFQLVDGDLLPLPNADNDWPSYKYDAAGTGRRLDSLVPPLRLVWARNLGSPINVSSPVVSGDFTGGRVYVGTSNTSTSGEARMVSLEATTGELVWELPTRNDVKSTAALADGHLYFTNSCGTVFALDAADGTLLWQAQLGDSLMRWEMTSPTFHDGTIYVGGAPAMSALDAGTGSERWQHSGSNIGDFIPAVYSAPAVSEDVAVFTSKAGIFAYDPATGAELWAHSDPYSMDYLHRSAGIVNSVVYTAGAGFNTQRLRAYGAQTGDLLYGAATSQSLHESTSAPVVGPGPGGMGSRVIVADGGAHPGGASPQHGSLQSFLPDSAATADWEIPLGAVLVSSLPYQRIVTSINSTPAWAGNHVYFGADDGRLYGADIDGNVVWTHDLGVPIRSSPAIAGNMLFVNGADGTLYAFASTFVETAAGESVRSAPHRTRLLGSWPNPCNPFAWIGFELGAAGPGGQPVTLKIYHPTGRLVRSLLDEALAPGRHRISWDGRDDQQRRLPSMVYFYELRAGDHQLRGKLVLAR